MVVVELFKQQIYIFMGVEYIGKGSMFPKLVTVAEFTIGKALVVIVFQGMIVDIPVFGKIVRNAIIATVAIAKANDLARIVKFELFGLFKNS